MLRILLVTRAFPCKTRSRACFITCCTRGIISSSCCWAFCSVDHVICHDAPPHPPFHAFIQLLLNDLQQLIVVQRLICVPHPGLPQIGHFPGDETIGEAALQAAGGDHALRSLASSRSSRHKYWFSSLIAS